MTDAPPPRSEPSPIDHALAEPALHHRGAEGAGVEVHEALVHDGGALGQVGAEPHPVGVGDPHAAGRHVVEHAGELVERVHQQGGAGRRGPRTWAAGSSSTATGPSCVHATVGQVAEDPVEVDGVGRDEAVGEQVQAEVDVVGVERGRLQVGDGGGDGAHVDAAHLVAARRPGPRRRPSASSMSPARTGSVPASPPPSVRSGRRNQVSSTRSSAVKVARPTPRAPPVEGTMSVTAAHRTSVPVAWRHGRRRPARAHGVAGRRSRR